MGKHLELTPRLRQIAAWVRQGAHLADVGTDHAYLPVWLTLQGRVASAIASDLRRGPLDRAQETGRRYGVGDRGFLYPVIEAGAGEMHLTLGRQWAGADLLYDPLGDRYIIEKIIQLQAAEAGSNRASAPEARERGDYARAVITELLQMREEWRHANCPGN